MYHSTYYKRTGKADKKKIFLDVKYRDKDFAKSHGVLGPGARSWFCWDRVPDALKEFEPIRKTRTSSLRRLSMDSANIASSLLKRVSGGRIRMPQRAFTVLEEATTDVQALDRYMVSDCWTGAMDDDSIQIIHDCVGNPMMYDGGCSLMIGCSGLRLISSDKAWRVGAMKRDARATPSSPLSEPSFPIRLSRP